MIQGPGRTSFAKSYSRYYRFLINYLRKRGVLPEDCEDLVQETYLRCYKTMSQEADHDHKKLLITVARNLHIDQFRRRKKFPLVHDMDTLNCIADCNEGRKELAQRVLTEQLVASLVERNGTRFFKMHYGSGYKFQEIADLSQTSIGTVASQIFRYRNSFHKAFGEQLQNVDEFLA